jgi:large subunit ribosomal protein L4
MSPADNGPEEPEDLTAAESDSSPEDASTAAAQPSAAEETGEATEVETDSSEAPEGAEATTDEQDEEPEDAEPAPAKPARRRTTKAAASDEEPAAKAPARAKKVPVKPKREAPQAAYGLVDADLPAEIFDAKVNVPLIHQVVVAQQAAARQGTHSAKTRGDVRGGGKKPYRQKGTGRARQGSIRAPQFAGGGVVHGPVPRSYAQKTPKKMKAAALRGALSDRARHGLIVVVGGFVDGAEPKTRDALAVLTVATGGTQNRSVLVVAESADHATWKSLRNAPGVHLIDPGQLNTYDVLVSDRVVFTSSALAKFVARAGSTADREDA